MAATDLSVIVVSWNTCDLLRDCLEAVCRQLRTGDEVIVVDNHSNDGSPDMVRALFPAIQLIANPANVGFARANNQGIQSSRGDYILLLNSDTIAPDGALHSLVNFMKQHTDAGACGPRLTRPDGAAQPYAFGNDPTLTYLLQRTISRVLFRRALHNWATDVVQQVDWVSGACLMVRRAVIQHAGLLDENIFMYFEDNEWCLRIRNAGWKIFYNPQVSILHLGGQSLARNPSAQQAYYRSLEYFYAKHYGVLARSVLKVLLLAYQRIEAR